MSGVTMLVSACEWEMWQLSAGISPFAMSLMQSFQLDSELPGNQLLLHPAPAKNVAAQTSVFGVGRRP
jgi:hypothetical protein